jgi:hypothetical protein
MMILSALSPRSVSIAIMLAGSAVPDVAMAQSSPKPTADSLIDDILKYKHRPPQGRAAPPATPSTAAPAQETATGAVTAAEIQAVRTKILPCWWTTSRKPSGQVAIRVEVAPDQMPVKADIVDKVRYDRDPDFRAAADVAHRAIMNPRCQPWPLSPEKYNSWRIITFNFDSRDY